MKRGIFILLFIFFLFIIPLTQSQNLDAIEDTKDNLVEKGERLKAVDATETANYLREEWITSHLNKTGAGRVLISISDFLTSLNPIFKLVLQTEYSFSLAFFLSIFIWGVLFGILLPISDAVFENKLFAIVGSAIIASLVGISGVIKSAVDILNTAINNIWIFWLSMFAAIIIGIILIRFGKLGAKEIEKLKKESEEEKLKRAREAIKAEGSVSKKSLDSYKKK